MLRQRAGLAVAGCALVLLAVGCGSTITGADRDAPFASWDGFDRDKPFMQAGLEGIVRLDDGCIRVGGKVLSLPTETTWDPDTEELTHNGFTIKVRQEVNLGGGYGGVEFADRIPDSCDPASIGPDGIFKTTTYNHPPQKSP